MNARVIELVQKRANGYCEKCGKPASVAGMAYHHRKLRSRGGQDTVSNLLRVHNKCHNTGTDSIHLNPSLATDKGWMVPSWEEPDKYPLVKVDGSIVLLRDDGTEEVIEEGNGWR